MRWTDVHIRGVGAALGDIVALTDLPASDPGGTRQRAISLARGRTSMDLAVQAARNALDSVTMTTDGPLPVLGLHFHSAIWRGSRGIDFWSCAAYVRSRLGVPAGPGISTEINAMSNSLVGALDLSSRILSGSPETATIILTGGETFGAPAFDHLTADHGIAYGDGGSALILGHSPGLARVLATTSWTDPTLEELHRGHARFVPAGATELGIESVRLRKQQYLAAVGAASVTQRSTAGITQVMRQVLADVDLPISALDWVLLPHYGRRMLHNQCLAPLDLPVERTLQAAGDQWGHIGPNDQLIGLTHLFAQQAVEPGDLVALVGIGIGMTWTAAILQIETVPAAMRKHTLPLRWPWRP
ncbi:hypothetical protein FPZ12_008065 [Amycolatopsis acidicola]|uniref:Beta-ketoacyl-[acyl-carrier-protein] synthase III C-terminal domain-containing protein n=1 Tax=Amycolatopsis acidicola TaxID=2596893 RepID=A0A5N0VC74_9PSEU|nr:3-oxoacyl-[acyl-carrier-protein] synthase III C-terminal domain-containing protein [Amycolatopsis acidicola]KAA9163976.1 hypothetical protein FPZ12_008065 [Amycolatopsis acidicola]